MGGGIFETCKYYLINYFVVVLISAPEDVSRSLA